ncbi:MAG: hypothetical protein D6710_11360, partial [Nitrospirae bacterium]
AEGKAYKGWVKGYNRGALVNDGFVDALEGLFHEFKGEKLMPFSKDLITRIVIERGDDLIDLKRTGRGWFMEYPFKMKADENAVKGLINPLTAERVTSVEDWIDSYRRLPEKVWLLIEGIKGLPDIDMDGYLYGSSMIVHPFKYQKVFYVTDALWKALNRPASEFVRREVFPLKEKDIKKISLLRDDKEAAVIRKGHGWGYKDTPLGDSAEKLVKRVLSLRALKLAKPFKLDKRPLLTIKVERIDNSLIELSLFDLDVSYMVKEGQLVRINPYTNRREREYFYPATISTYPYIYIIGSFQLEHLMDLLKEPSDIR